ncbi:hypothetical protein ACFPOE_15970 [Caenimonas terrae]|uniref:Collagen-like protein n=1 Tax=Caenimonas terrae TaxID=696074 RepID=A0ABW0NGC9_9BURK
MMADAKAWGLALLAAMALTACGDKAVNGANANAPGSPGTGNATVQAAPVAPDTPTGGSPGLVGTATAGSSGGGAVPGTTGRGTVDPGGRSQPAQPGVGTAGGLGGNSGLGMTGSFPATNSANAGAAPHGSTNSTPSTSVGNR